MTKNEIVELKNFIGIIKFISEKMIDLSTEIDYQSEQIDKKLLNKKESEKNKNDI